MIGCACSTSRSSSSASRITSVHDRREASRFGASLAAWQATRSRPASFASYIARSALTSTSSPVRRRESNGATPIEALTLRRRPEWLEMRTARIASSRSPAIASASSGPPSGTSTANSSPPRRAITSPSRSRSRSASATLPMSWSPALWPSVSLTFLNRSTSISTRRAARAVAGDVVDVALELALERAAVEQPGERVVVGHVAQLGLVAAALRDVLGLGEEVQRRAAGVAHERGRHGHPDDVAVVVQVAALAARGRDLAGEHAVALLVVLRAVVGVQQREHRAALELGGLVAGDRAQRAVDAQQPPVGADDRHPGGALLEGGAEALLGLGQRALGLDALVDVADDRVRLGDPAGGVADDVQLGLDPDRAAVAAHEPEGGADVVDLAGAVAHREDDGQVLDEHEVVARRGRPAPPGS